MYLSQKQADSTHLGMIAIVCLELAIKNYEDRVISFEECSKVLNNDATGYHKHH